MSSLDMLGKWQNLSLDDLAIRVARLDKSDFEEIAGLASAMTASDKFIPNVGPQMTAYFSPADIVLYGGEAGGGKLLDINELLPTPFGFVRMGDVSVGDSLFDQGGAACRVTAVSQIESRKTYKLTFDDGSEVVCCNEHLWHTFTAKDLANLLKRSEDWKAKRRANRPSRVSGRKSAKFAASLAARNAALARGSPLPTGSVKTTQRIVDTLLTKSGRRNHAVPVAGAIDLPDADLPLDPYVLGAWLGDGHSVGGGFTGIDQEIWGEIERAGFRVTHSKTRPAHHIHGLIGCLRRLGVLGNKHIPQPYLRGSIAQRLRLLQGLMDTDGHAARDGGCEFDNTNRAIVDGVYELVCSLGLKATLQEGVAKLDGRAIGPKWRVKFVTTLPVFLLPRKAARMRGWIRPTAKFRYIVDAIEIDPPPMRCIRVDSPTHLYLCSKSFIPTHNSGLVLGLALTVHQRSLIMREQFNDLSALTEDLIRLNGGRRGFNGSNPPSLRTDDGRLIQFSGATKDQWQGQAFDLKAIDECVQVLEDVVRFHIGWVRSIVEGQRSRVMLTTNPPIDDRGQYIIGMFRPWLDLTHPRPAKDGELRWYVRDPDDVDVEVDGPDPVLFPGAERSVKPLSRTFIRARLTDNPYLANTGYDRMLDNMPEPYRSALRDGKFMGTRKDKEDQVIPIAWIKEAQARWTPRPPEGVPMTAIGMDVSQGGADPVVLAPRHGAWHAKLIEARGKECPDGPAQAALVERHRRDNAVVVVDVTGGYGGDVTSVFKSNKTPHVRFNAAADGVGKAHDGSGRGFENKRAQAWWRFREALNPDQPGGSEIALPPDAELEAELASPTLVPDKREIMIEAKRDIRKRLGRSTNKADAVIMGWDDGNKGAKRVAGTFSSGWQPPSANVGHQDLKQRLGWGRQQ